MNVIRNTEELLAIYLPFLEKHCENSKMKSQPPIAWKGNHEHMFWTVLLMHNQSNQTAKKAMKIYQTHHKERGKKAQREKKRSQSMQATEKKEKREKQWPEKTQNQGSSITVWIHVIFLFIFMCQKYFFLNYFFLNYYFFNILF